MERKIRSTGNGIKRFGRDATSSFKSVALGAAGMLAGFTAIRGIGGLISGSVSGFREFEQGMQNVKATTGLAGVEGEKDFALLKDKAREMGSATSKTAAEAAEGLNYLALAGWSTQEMLDGIHPVLKLAEAGALDLGRSSDLVTDSMASLGLGTKDLDGYLDMVAQTSRKSNTNMDTMMDAMIIAGGTFERLNVPLAESNAFLGVLANRGTKGAEAGTAINAIMDRLTDTTGPAGKAMEKLGISAFDANGEFRGMETVLSEVQKKMSKMTDKQKAYYTKQIAGLNHGKSFQKMINGLGDEYAQLKTDIENANGALDEMGDAQLDSFDGAMALMSSAIDDVQLVIGEALIPVLRAAAEYITDNMPRIKEAVSTTIDIVKTKLMEMKTSWEEGTGVIGLFKDGLELALNGFRWLMDNSELVVAAVMGIVGGIAAFKILTAISSALSIFNGLMMALRTGTLMATAAQMALNGAMLANPMTWVALAIGVLIAAGVALYMNWEVVKEKAQALWDKTKEVGRGIGAAFSSAFDTVKSAAATALNFVIGKINDVIGLINKIPGVNAPLVPMVDTSQVHAGIAATGGATMKSFAVGTDRVPHDMVANIHKDEMIIPAKQSAVLRSQGIGINNITKRTPPAVKTGSPSGGNVTVSNGDGALYDLIRTLLDKINNLGGGGDINVSIDARDKSPQQIMDELIPILKLRMANM
ncbi:phage tail tape measure protein [Streptococcus mutans]|nr:phage tail tape measure protein [Streptococcus mutans]